MYYESYFYGVSDGNGLAPLHRTTQTRLTPAPTGMAGHVLLDCCDNPDDLRPALTVAKSLIDEELHQLEKGQKLIILFGENHDRSSHILLQSAITNHLHQRFYNRLMVALEHPHTLEEENTKIHPAAFYNNKYLSGYAPYTNAYQMYHLHNNGIATCFNDTAKYRENDTSFIDQTNKKTRAFIQDHYPDDIIRLPSFIQKILRKITPRLFDESNVRGNTPHGLTLRNAFMAYTALQKAQKGGHDIIFQSTGAQHVLGDKDSLGFNPYSESLCMTFKTFGEEITGKPPRLLTIMPLIESDHSSKLEQARNHQGASLFITGFNTRPFHLDTGFILRNAFKMPNSEHEFVETLWRVSGGAELGLPEPQLYGEYKALAAQASQPA